MKIKIRSISGAQYEESAIFLTLSPVEGWIDSDCCTDVDEIKDQCGLDAEVEIEPSQFEVLQFEVKDWNEYYLKAEGLQTGIATKQISLDEIERMASENDEVDNLNDGEVYFTYRDDVEDDHDAALRAVKSSECYRTADELGESYAENLDISTLLRYVDYDRLGEDLLHDLTYAKVNGRIYVFHD